jgi:calcium-dependent protein kinase
MGNKHLSIRRKKKKHSKKEKNEDDMEGFFLEDWEILNDKDKINEFSENKNKISFNSEVLISQVKTDPFQDYTEIRELGSGSFATVKLVKNNVTGMIRAMKIIQKKKPEIIDNSGQSGTNDMDILNEINILKQIDHPNIVKIFEFYNSKDAYYLITEYCEGGELFQLISQKKILTEIQCAYIMYQLLSAIKYCHKMKIMHRDLKPENILISKHDPKNDFYDVKICDFGTSQVFKKGEWQSQPCGSVYYVAPEVLSKKYNSKCDLWSCGVIMFMLLSNKAPFGGRTDKDIIRNVVNGTYNKLFIKNCSEITHDLISKLLEKDYKVRINADAAMNHQFFTQFKIKNILNNINDESIINRLVNNLKNYKCQSIIQETALAYLVHNYPDLDDVVNACKLFNQIDVNGDGKITSEILYKGISKYIHTSTIKNDIIQIFENLDRDHNNYIGYEEFIRAAVDKHIFLTDEVLKFAFKYFDINDTGEITYSSISSIFKDHIKSKGIEESLKKIMDEVDEDRDGKITYSQFCILMKNIL